MSTTLVYDILRRTSLSADAVTNEASWQCAPLQHDCLVNLINVSNFNLLLQCMAPKWCSLWGLNEGRHAVSVSRSMRWSAVLLQSSLVDQHCGL